MSSRPKGHRHFLAFAHRFGEAGTIGAMDCAYSSDEVVAGSYGRYLAG
jgi:hypothetical protein